MANGRSDRFGRALPPAHASGDVPAVLLFLGIGIIAAQQNLAGRPRSVRTFLNGERGQWIRARLLG
jgi:hypothetical protein